jgi:hypothetical protein
VTFDGGDTAGLAAVAEDDGVLEPLGWAWFAQPAASAAQASKTDTRVFT